MDRLLLATFGVLLARRVLGPVAALQAAAGRIAQGNYRHPASLRADDDFTAIATAMNRMMEKWDNLDAHLEAQLEVGRRRLSTALLAAAGFARATGSLPAHTLPATAAADAVNAAAQLKAALATDSGDDPRLGISLETALCRACLLADRPDEAAAAYARAVASAEMLQDDALLVHPLRTILSARAWPGLLRTRIEAGRRAMELSPAAVPAALLADIATWRFIDFVEAGDRAAAQAVADQAERAVADCGESANKLRAEAMREVLAVQAGLGPDLNQRLEAARRLAMEMDQPALAEAFALQLCFVCREQGRLPEMEPLVHRHRSAEPANPLWIAIAALSDADAGLTGQARAHFEEVAASGFGAIPRDGRWAVTIAVLAEVCAGLEDLARGVALLELLEPWAEHQLTTEGICLGPAHRYLGLLAAARGDWAKAEAALEIALTFDGAAGQPLSRTRTLIELARILEVRHDSGDTARAAALLDEALAEATRLHAGRLREECLTLLSRKPRSGPAADGLSPAERRVLRLLASGATNRAIGEQLFLSHHTVGNHVRNILAKTNTANRTEAANYARRHGLVDS